MNKPRTEMSHEPLSLELVPASMWGKNVRAVISRDNWDALRWSFGATKNKPRFMKLALPYPDWRAPIECKICGAEEDNLELHEQWQYDDEHLVQRLIGMIPICHHCHLTMHLGRANQLGLADKAKDHLAKVNRWTAPQVEKHVKKAFEEWMLRSQHQYTLDVNWLATWIPESKIHVGWLEKSKRWAGTRLDAIAWAQELLDSDAVIVDTETTGLLGYSRAEVIELAIITMKGEVVYKSRFRPRYKIPRRTTDIHGITNEDVEGKPVFKDEYSNIMESLHSKVAIAYKADFDKGVIERTCRLYKLETPECRWECAMHTYRAFQESGKWLPLPNSKHSALDDCKAVLKLIRRMAKG